MEFMDKVVLITGATGGIGSAVTRLFAENGAKLALVSTSEAAAEKMAVGLGFKQDNYLAIAADVSKEEDVKKYVDATLVKFGRIDVFFNNAGVEGKVQSIVDTTADNLAHVLGVNLYGVYYGLKHVLKVMLEQQSGSVINTASVAGLKGFPGLAPYVASKHAVVGITRSAALEVVGKGVRINAICPAPVDTRMMRSIEEALAENPADARKIFEEAVPMGRYATSQEIAELAYFLASAKSSYITGGIYPIDGGTMAK
ncbi:MAG: SDR family NAD(P)-dependent oxidoreductase [Dethiobacteraceae bacterium]